MKNSIKWLFRLAAAAVCCILLYRVCSAWITSAQSRPAVGLVGSPDIFTDYSFITDALQADGYQALRSFDSSPERAIMALQKKGVSAIVLQPGSSLTRAAAEIIQNNHLAVFLLGEDSARIYNYDKAWGIAARPADAGEQIGTAIAFAYRRADIPDLYENQFLDYIYCCPADDPVKKSILEECEHQGIYMQDLTPLPEEEPSPQDPAALAELWRGCKQPELILCTDAAQANCALAAAEQLGWLDSEAPVSFTAIANSRAEAAALHSMGAFSIIAYFDEDAANRDLVTMLENVLEGCSPSVGTSLRYDDDSGCFWLSYLMYDSSK